MRFARYLASRYFPFVDLRTYRSRDLPRDLMAAVALVFMTVPQGVAYAIIAGLPPAMGLYAAAVPAVVGSLMRSSRHVVTGPTNAVSLLVGAAVAAQVGGTPAEIGVTLAFTVGLLQLFAGLVRIDALVDYISNAVFRGYMTGAAVLIFVGQLPNVTATAGATGDLVTMMRVWLSDIASTNGLSVGLAIGTAVAVLGLRRIDPRIPGAILALVGGIALDAVVDLRAHGLKLVSDLTMAPTGFVPFTVPNFAAMSDLFQAALACAVLSLVESSAAARAIAARTAQRLDIAAEFSGQGLANVAAGLFGGYPVGGSLTRSVLNERAGAVSRLSGAASGVLMLLVLLFLGPFVDRTPIASLAGLVLVVATDLIDRPRIRRVLYGTTSDRIAFVVTLVGTWMLPLDKAIYVGIAISLVLFLRRARLLAVREMVVGDDGRFQEIDPKPGGAVHRCGAIRILNVAGPLFFAVAGELEAALIAAASEPGVRVVVLRMRQAQDLDATTVAVIEATRDRLAREGKRLVLLGMREAAIEQFERTGAAERIGRENLFAAQPGWFIAMESALARALELAGPHACHEGGEGCPFERYLAAVKPAASSRSFPPHPSGGSSDPGT